MVLNNVWRNEIDSLMDYISYACGINGNAWKVCNEIDVPQTEDQNSTNDCRQNSNVSCLDEAEIEGRVVFTSTVDESTGDHEYNVRGLICSQADEGCDEEYANKVFQDVNKNDVPFGAESEGSGDRVLIPYVNWPFGRQPITHIEDVAGRASVNVTQRGHNFHPGDVVHKVHFEDGKLYYDVTGRGTGLGAGFNNWVGQQLFQPGVEEIVERYGY